MTIDWGTGYYERTAEQLLPAARVVVDTAAPRAGERVLDVGTGTGNAALLAAERGATVVGVDPAARLLDVARGRAHDAGADIEFLLGEAAALPVPDASFDVVVSVFAAVFAPDAPAALAGMARALADHGRLVISSWVPGGGMGRMAQVAGEAFAAASGRPAGPPPFAWHDRAAVGDLAGRHGLKVSTDEHSIVFAAASAAELVDDDAEHHPVAINTRRVVEASGGSWPVLRARMIAALEEGNEDPTTLRVTSRYVVHTFTRG